MSKKESKTNRIGLETEKTEKLAKKLNKLLANYQLYYQNLRGFHWNIKGKNFFELHVKFEELYTEAQQQIDEIAERILTLGHQPLHTFSDYLSVSDIKEIKGVSKDETAVKTVVANLNTLLEIERKVLDLAGEQEDEGTTDLISGLVSGQEKHVWMLTAWLG
ncbi:DNA starvation/stationary phase protection protein [Algivirga pacifica]|uniref:Dps family protein n=1 Tax=Algivirga pacifica TaxID=1162670 RepID=A0ABP9DNN9_9BACT